MAVQFDEQQTQSSVLAEFDQLTDVLRSRLSSLEERVFTRTHDLQTVAEISKQVTTILDLQSLLDAVVELTKAQFKLYHAHVYLLDDNGETLRLAAGAGAAGAAMKERGHSIRLDHQHSLVARAARLQEAVVVNNVASAPDFLPNPHLPDTRSEMAIPMVAGLTLIGVLDVQSDQLDRFDTDDVQIQSSLAGQIAIAVQNAHSFEATQLARQETELLYKLSAVINSAQDEQQIVMALVDHWPTNTPLSISLTAWDTYNYDTAANINILGDWRPGLEDKMRGAKVPLAHFPSLPMFSRTDVLFFDDVAQEPKLDEQTKASILQYGIKAVLSAPLTSGSQWVGVISLSAHEARQHSESEIRVLRSLAEQISTAVERLRLQRESERYVAEMRTVNELSAAISAELDPNQLLPQVVNLTKERFNLYHVHIYLLDDAGVNLVLAAGAGEAGRLMLERGHKIPLSRPNSLVATAARTRETIVTNDVTQAPNFLPNPLLPETRSEMSIPMVVGATLIGVLDVQSDQANRFTQRDVQIKSSLAAQIAIAVQNARSFKSVQAAQQETQRVYDMSQDMIGTASFAGYFLTLNPAWERTLGYTLDELKAAPFLSFVHPDDVEPTLAEAGKLAQGAKAISFENRYRCSDDTYVWLSWNSVPDTETGTIYFVVRNITEQKATALELQNLLRETQAARQESEKRAAELRTVTAVSAAVSTLLDTEQLLAEVVQKTRDDFGLYHAHIYLLDDMGANLVLAAGAGEAGRMMKERGHSIPVNREDSIVATAARTQTGVISNDVTKAANFLPNPLLPETKSEMAIPMVIGSTLIGVLDVQSRQIDRFTQDDLQIKSALASQISVAVQNARTFQFVLAAQQETQRIYDMSQDLIGTANFDGYFLTLNPAWERTLGFTIAELRAAPFLSFVHPDDVEPTLAEAGKLAQGARAISFENRYRRADGSYVWLSWNSVPDTETATIYFVVRNITEQKATALELERLLNEAQTARQESEKHAAELRTVTDVSAAVSTLLDTEQLLTQVAQKTRDDFGLYHAHIYLLDDAGVNLMLAAGAGEPGRIMKERGHKIPLDRTNSIVATAARSREAVIANNVASAPNFLPNPLLPETASEMAVPMVVGDTVIGVLDVQSEQLNRFTADDVQIKTALASQVAIAVQNARAFQNVQAAQKETQRVYDMSQDLIGTATFQGYFVTLNPAWERTLGFTIEQLKAAPFISFVHPDDVEPTLAEAGKLAQGAKAISFENRYRCVDDSYVWLSWNSVPDTETGMIYFVVRDVTDQKATAFEMERLLRQAEEQAQREKLTAERLRELDRLKSQFLANMSHELRTPLNSIIGYSEILLDGDDGELSEEAAEDVETIYNSGKHLLAIINDILDRAKIESGQMTITPTPMDLQSLVDEVVTTSQVLVKDKTVALKCIRETDVPLVKADRLRIKQVITNLVSNAVKFTENGSVTVRYGLDEQHDAFVEVADTGIGLKPEHLGQIFEQFSQVDGSSTRRAGGTGLGLTISQHFIRMHGSEITVTSDYGKGSTFRFTLPLAEKQPA